MCIFRIEGFISKVTYLQFFKIWIWAYQGIKHTFFDGIHYVFCWKRRKYRFRSLWKFVLFPMWRISQLCLFPKSSISSWPIYIYTFSHQNINFPIRDEDVHINKDKALYASECLVFNIGQSDSFWPLCVLYG